MNKQKRRQREKRRNWRKADEQSAIAKKLADSLKQAESAKWAEQVEKLGSVEYLAAMQAKQRLTKIPRKRPHKQRIVMRSDDMPFETINLKTGVLSLSKLGKSVGYAAGAYELGFRYVNGKWRKILDK